MTEQKWLNTTTVPEEALNMAKGENAQKHGGREYWSSRARGKGAWGLS